MTLFGPTSADVRQRHTSVVGIPASCSLIIPMICASVKRLFRIRLLLQKVEQTRHHNEGSFGGQVKTKVALEAIREEMMLVGLYKKYGV